MLKAFLPPALSSSSSASHKLEAVKWTTHALPIQPLAPPRRAWRIDDLPILPLSLALPSSPRPSLIVTEKLTPPALPQTDAGPWLWVDGHWFDGTPRC
jgi:hypothetical protein